MTVPRYPNSIGNPNQKDKKILDQIRWDMLSTYNSLVEAGIYPTFRAIMRGMPYWVHENLGARLRREMIEQELIAKPREHAAYRYKNNRDPSDSLAHMPSTDEIDARKEEIARERLGWGRVEKVAVRSMDQMSPKEVSEWARMRYRASWRSIQALLLRSAMGRLQDRVEALDTRHIGRRDELFGG